MSDEYNISQGSIASIIDEIRDLSKQIEEVEDSDKKAELIKKRDLGFTALEHRGVCKYFNLETRNIGTHIPKKEHFLDDSKKFQKDIAESIDPGEKGVDKQQLTNRQRFFKELVFLDTHFDEWGIKDVSQKYKKFYDIYAEYAGQVDQNIASLENEIPRDKFASSEYAKWDDLSDLDRKASNHQRIINETCENLVKQREELKKTYETTLKERTPGQKAFSFLKLKDVFAKPHPEIAEVIDIDQILKETAPEHYTDIEKVNFYQEKISGCLDKTLSELNEKLNSTEAISEEGSQSKTKAFKKRFTNLVETGETNAGENKNERLEKIRDKIQALDTAIEKCKLARHYAFRMGESAQSAKRKTMLLCNATFQQRSVYDYTKGYNVVEENHQRKIQEITQVRREFRNAEDRVKKHVKNKLALIAELENRISPIKNKKVQNQVKKFKNLHQKLTLFLDNLENSWMKDSHKTVSEYIGILDKADGIIYGTTQEAINYLEKTNKIVFHEKPIDPVSATDGAAERRKQQVRIIRNHLPKGQVVSEFTDITEIEEGTRKSNLELENQIRELRGQIETLTKCSKVSGVTVEEDAFTRKAQDIKNKLLDLDFDLKRAKTAASNIIDDTIFIPDYEDRQDRRPSNGNFNEFARSIPNDVNEIKVKLANGEIKTIKIERGARCSDTFSEWEKALREWHRLQTQYNQLVADLNELIKQQQFEKNVSLITDSQLKPNAIAEQFYESGRKYNQHVSKFNEHRTKGNLLLDSLKRYLHQLEFDLKKHTIFAKVPDNSSSLSPNPYETSHSIKRLLIVQEMQHLEKLIDLVEKTDESPYNTLEDLQKALESQIEKSNAEIEKMSRRGEQIKKDFHSKFREPLRDVLQDLHEGQQKIKKTTGAVMHIIGAFRNRVGTALRYAEELAKLKETQELNQLKIKNSQALLLNITEGIKREVNNYYDALYRKDPSFYEKLEGEDKSFASLDETFTKKQIFKSFFEYSFKDIKKGFFNVSIFKVNLKLLNFNPFELFGVLKAWKLNPDSAAFKTVENYFGKKVKQAAGVKNLNKTVEKYVSGDNAVSQDQNKSNMVAYEDPDLKKPQFKSRPLQPQVATFNAHPKTAFEHAIRSIFYDVEQVLAEQWHAEKKAVVKTFGGIKSVANKSIAVAKSVGQFSKNASVVTFSFVGDKLCATANGAKTIVQKGIYVLPHVKTAITSSSLKGFAGYGFFLEGARVIPIYERQGRNAALLHGGKSALFMAVFAETPYAFMAKSAINSVRALGTAGLSLLRVAGPVFLAYGTYKVGTAGRLVGKTVPDWAAEHRGGITSRDFGVVSDVAAQIVLGTVKAIGTIANPISNEIVRSTSWEGNQPEDVLPLLSQLNVWGNSAERMQEVMDQKQHMRQQLIRHCNDVKLKEDFGKLFDIQWEKELFKLSNAAKSIIYRTHEGKLDTYDIQTSQDRKLLQKANVIACAPFEAVLENGEESTLYKLAMSGQREQKDQWGNLLINYYIVDQEQLEDIYNTQRFTLVEVDEKDLDKAIVLGESFVGGEQSFTDYMQYKLHRLALIYGPAAADMVFETKGELSREAKETAKRMYHQNFDDMQTHFKEYENSYKEQSTDSPTLASNLAIFNSHGAEWTKQKQFTIVEFDNSSLYGEEAVIACVSAEAVAMRDPFLENTVFLEQKQYTKASYKQQTMKGGGLQRIPHFESYKENALFDGKGQAVFIGDSKRLKEYQEKHPELTIIRDREVNDAIVNQKFTVFNPVYGYQRSKVSYSDMLMFAGDREQVLEVKKTAVTSGKNIWSVSHKSSGMPLFVAQSIPALNKFLSSDVMNKYTLIKPYETSDRQACNSEIIVLNTKPGQGIVEKRNNASSMEVTDVKSDKDVFKMRPVQGGYQLRGHSNGLIFAKASLEQIDDYFANHSSKAKIVFEKFGVTDLQANLAQLDKHILESKVSFGASVMSSVKFLETDKRTVTWVNNDRRDHCANIGAFIFQESDRISVITDLKTVRQQLGEEGLLTEKKSKEQKAIYTDLYGKKYPMRKQQAAVTSNKTCAKALSSIPTAGGALSYDLSYQYK